MTKTEKQRWTIVGAIFTAIGGIITSTIATMEVE